MLVLPTQLRLVINNRHCNSYVYNKCSGIIPSSGSDTFLGSVSLSDDTFILRIGFRLLLPVFPRFDFVVHCENNHYNTLHSQSQNITQKSAK